VRRLLGLPWMRPSQVLRLPRGRGKVARGTIPNPIPPSVGASVVEPVTRSSFVRVIMTQCISYVQCHEKVVKSFKARPPELVALGPSVFSHRHGRLAAKGRGGAINPKLVVPSHRLHSKRVLR
jgi:hypothetical protein